MNGSYQLEQEYEFVEEICKIDNQLKIMYCNEKDSGQEVVIFTVYVTKNSLLQKFEEMLRQEPCYITRPKNIIALASKTHIIYDIKLNYTSLTDYLQQYPALNENTLWQWVLQVIQEADQLEQNQLAYAYYDLRYFYVDVSNERLMHIGTILASIEQSEPTKQIKNLFNVIMNKQIRDQNQQYLLLERSSSNSPDEYIQRAKETFYFPSLMICLETAFQENAEYSIHFYNFFKIIEDYDVTLAALQEYPLFLQTIINNRSILYSESFNLEEFKVIKQLGQGAYGSISYAIHLQSEQKVALKYSKKVEVEEKEANFLKQIVHPNIVRFYGDFIHSDDYYIIMQYCEGGNMFDTIKSKTYDNEQALTWMAQIASGVWYLHQKGIIHRDIKPQNVLLSNGQALIADFGISKEVFGETKTETGTRYYISPEIFSNEPYDNKTDVFSLGLLFFNIIERGKHPFSFNEIAAEKFYEQQNEDLLLREVNKVTRQFRMLIYEMLRIDDSQRFNMSDVCTCSVLFEKIQQLGLPCPQGRNSILSLEMASKNLFLDISVLYAQPFHVELAIERKLSEYESVFDEFYFPVVYSSKKFIISELSMQNTQYSQIIAQDIENCMLRNMAKQANQQEFEYEEKANSIYYRSEEITYYVGPVFKLSKLSKINYIFAYVLELLEDFTVPSNTFIVVEKIDCHSRRINLTLSHNSLLGCQQAESAKLKVLGDGLLFSDQLISQNSEQFEQIYSCSQLLNLLGEFSQICCPDVFKEKFGFCRILNEFD